jgi:hypothetical protein
MFVSFVSYVWMTFNSNESSGSWSGCWFGRFLQKSWLEKRQRGKKRKEVMPSMPRFFIFDKYPRPCFTSMAKFSFAQRKQEADTIIVGSDDYLSNEMMAFGLI